LFLKQYNGGSGKLLLLEELLADCFSAGTACWSSPSSPACSS
jgi:hypothetical protein